jgi:thioredoxin-like negative regulator of GroEL
MDLAREAAEKPRLVFFHSRASGRARRIDGFLANVLQRRQNHDTFRLARVYVEDHPELAERFDVDGSPTLFVVDGNRVVARLAEPAGTQEIEEFLAPWLQPGRAHRNGVKASAGSSR